MSSPNQFSHPCRESLTFLPTKSADGAPRMEMSFPESFFSGEGCKSFLRFEGARFTSGLSAYLMELNLDQPMKVPFVVETESSFAISFMLSGSTSFYYDDRKKHNYNYNSPVSVFYDIQSGTGMADYAAREHMRCLALHFDNQAMHRLLGEDILVWNQVSRARSTTMGHHFGIAIETTPAMYLAAHQALCCPKDTPHRGLFLESKALELVTLYLQGLSLMGKRSLSLRDGYIPPHDRDKLYAARDILSQELSDPPTISALARRVGLNECKLKQMFKHNFQSTIYGYVQSERMRRAKILLEDGMSVSQAASTLGYVNFSHFAAAFRKHHGVIPSTLKR